MSSLLRRLGRVRPAWWFVLALTLRLAAAAVLPARTLGDVDRDSPTYLGCARSLLENGAFALDGRTTAMVPPLYPWLLAPVLALGPRAFFPVIRILQSVLMAAVCLFVFGAGRRLFGAESAALAALIVAVHPALIGYSQLVMTDALYTFLTAAGIWLLTELVDRPEPARAAALGFIWGLAALCREVGLLWGPASAALLLLARPRAFRPAAWLLAVWLVTFLPWSVRNKVEFGRAGPISLRGPAVVYLSQRIPENGDWVLDGPKLHADTMRLSEDLSTPWLRLAFEETGRNILHRPGAYARMLGSKLAELWLHPSGLVQLQSRPWAARAYLAAHLALLAAAAFGLAFAFRREPALAAPAALALALPTVVHVFVVFPLARYAVPLLPWFAMFAGGAIPSRPAVEPRRKAKGRK